MRFLVAIHHPTDYDGSQEPEQMGRDIDALNDEMQAAGVRFFAGGLQPPHFAKSLLNQPDGKVLVKDGPYLDTNEHVGGFWILDCSTLEDALDWGRKATIACCAPVEVRPFH